MQRPGANLAQSMRSGGIRRLACTKSSRLITRRSQVQILPPLLRKAPETVPFAFLECFSRFRLLPELWSLCVAARLETLPNSLFTAGRAPGLTTDEVDATVRGLMPQEVEVGCFHDSTYPDSPANCPLLA
jgi:hypothetical protein